eukprot:CAMPEP_0168478578 /NCGR_PEP_ID=MMETSP0228-20121227/63029_1 /TAXON_ID=133427 /ORGANISM="Protoceratium reticulatum, Strain CCCM 535 (=CCMP 1889)" /LENGTH=167 /DNA_ID=CAMNT_0008494841 /DNA_START=65 /DNA_END=564 /DNA_ORIENTATION=+
MRHSMHRARAHPECLGLPDEQSLCAPSGSMASLGVEVPAPCRTPGRRREPLPEGSSAPSAGADELGRGPALLCRPGIQPARFPAAAGRQPQLPVVDAAQRRPVPDREDGRAALAQRLVASPLSGLIQCARGFVEHHNECGRGPEQQPREGQPLLLARGQGPRPVRAL